MGVFGVWCGKCAKYLAFGTFTTLAMDALRDWAIKDGVDIISLSAFLYCF